jgi:hypothetical protein
LPGMLSTAGHFRPIKTCHDLRSFLQIIVSAHGGSAALSLVTKSGKAFAATPAVRLSTEEAARNGGCRHDCPPYILTRIFDTGQRR